MKRNGFTLIEIMVAIALMSAAIIPFMMVLSQNLKVSAATKQKYIGSHYAKELAEEIKLKKFGTTTSAILTNTAISAADRNGQIDIIDDYKGYDESKFGTKGIRDLQGNIVDTNYYRRVYVNYADEVNFADQSGGVTAGTTKKVTVECLIVSSTGDEVVAKISWFISAGG